MIRSPTTRGDSRIRGHVASEVTLATVDGGASMAIMVIMAIMAIMDLDLGAFSTLVVAEVRRDLVVDILIASEGAILVTGGAVELRGGDVLLTKKLGRPVVLPSQWRRALTLSNRHSSRLNNSSNSLAVHKMKRNKGNFSMELEKLCPVSWSHSE